jgi:glycosyltransferase involved in cell wall biosynthesis
MPTSIDPFDKSLVLVSVVIPCFNHGHLVGEAIESVLSQTYEPIELLVVDDGSMDNTSEVVSSYGVRCIRQENRGASEARNLGLRCSSGAFVLFLDSDDILEPTAVEAGVACLEAKHDAAFAFGRPDTVGLPQSMQAPRVTCDFYRRLLEGNYIWMPLILHRRSVVEEVGGFDRRYDPAEDFELYLRITRRLPIVFCDEMHGTYRRHSQSLSNNSLRMFRATSEVLRSQREHVRGDHDLRHAYRRGVANIRRAYGRWAVMDTRQQIGNGQFRAGVSSLVVLWKYDRLGFGSAFLGGLRCAVAKRIRRRAHD